MQVPSPRLWMACLLTKLCVALLSSNVMVLVTLCHSFTCTGIVIKSLFILYTVLMAELETIKLWHCKNPASCHEHLGTCYVPHCPLLLLSEQFVGCM